MAIRYRAKTATASGTIYTLHIHDTDYTGSVVNIELRTPGFSLSYHGGENVFTPIVPSTCTLPWLITSTAMETGLGLMMSSDEGRFRLVIRKGDTDASPIFWVGIITQDNLTIQDQPEPYDVELRAVCGLQLLNKQQYTPAQTNQTYIRHVIDILQLIGTDDLFETSGSAVTFLRGDTDVAPDVATAADPFDNVKLDGQFYDTSTNQYTAFDYTAEEWLSNLCRMYNSRVMLTDGTFMLLPVGKYINSSLGSVFLKSYLADYTAQADQSVTFLKVLGNDGTNGYRPTGWQKHLLPPVREIRRPLVYGDGLLTTNMPGPGATIYPAGASTGDTIASYTINTSRTYKQGTRFKLSGEAVLIIGYTSTTPHIGLLRVEAEIKVGGKYCRRHGFGQDTDTPLTIPSDEFEDSGSDVEYYDWGPPEEPQWTDTDTDRVQFGSDPINYNPVSGYVGGEGVTIVHIPLNFDSPELPADTTGTVRIAFTCTLKDADGTAPTDARKLETPAQIRFRCSAGGGESVSAHYVATNTNGATEVREEPRVYFGSELVAAGETIFNPSEVFNVNGALPDWISTLTTTAADLHDVCVRDIAQYFESPKEIYSGTYIGELGFVAPYRQLFNGDNSKTYLVVSLTYHAYEDYHELELHETGKSGSPTGSVVVYANPKPPTPGVFDVSPAKRTVRRFIQLASDQIADIETDVAAVTRQMDAQGGDSSILLAYLGDVKISSPTNGQILEYNTTAGRWANVDPGSGGSDNSLSETNQTIDAGTTRKIVLDAGAGQQVYFNVVDGEDNVLESIVAYGNGIVIQEKYGALAIRSTALFQGSIALYEASGNGINSLSIKAPASVSSNKTFTLPDSYGTNGQALTTNGAGILSWSTVGGGSGGVDVLPLANVSGRYTWSSADDGERVHTGNTSYGVFNFYNFVSEPSNSVLRNYSGSEVVGSTSGTMTPLHLVAYGIQMPTTNKKVRLDFMFRVQNAPSPSTWGFSLWSADRSTSGTTNNATVTYRGETADVIVNPYANSRVYHGSFTTSAAIAQDMLMILADNRAGALTSTTYMYATLAVYLVD